MLTLGETGLLGRKCLAWIQPCPRVSWQHLQPLSTLSEIFHTIECVLDPSSVCPEIRAQNKKTKYDK